MDALHEQCSRHQEDLDRNNPKTYVILDLPANRVTPDLSQRKKSETIYTYQFIQECAICGQRHPNYTRNTTGYFMRPFIGPRFEIITHLRKPIPPPTSFYHKDLYKLEDYEQYSTIYGHRSQGIYLTPLAVLLVTGASPWDISFRFMGCDGLREWNMRVKAEEVHSTLFTALWLCRISGDPYASMSLQSNDNVAEDNYVGFIGRSPDLEVNHSFFPFPVWPNLQPRNHTMTQ
jgi:hypothetical protein